MNTFANIMTVVFMILIMVLAGGLLWYIADYMKNNPDPPVIPDKPTPKPDTPTPDGPNYPYVPVNPSEPSGGAEVNPSRPDAGGNITPMPKPEASNIKNGVITDKLYFSDKLSCRTSTLMYPAAFEPIIYDAQDGPTFGNWTYRSKYGDRKVIMALINTDEKSVNHFNVINGKMQWVGADALGAYKFVGVLAYLVYDSSSDGTGYYGYKLVFPNARNMGIGADDPTVKVGEYGWYSDTGHAIVPDRHNYASTFDVNTCEYLVGLEPSKATGRKEFQVVINPECESWIGDYISVNDSIVNKNYQA